MAFCFFCLAARGAALGLIGVASGLEKLLLLGTEGESSPAIETLDRLVLKVHWMTSFLPNSRLERWSSNTWLNLE